jgi:hypothetical protein
MATSLVVSELRLYVLAQLAFVISGWFQRDMQPLAASKVEGQRAAK